MDPILATFVVYACMFTSKWTDTTTIEYYPQEIIEQGFIMETRTMAPPTCHTFQGCVVPKDHWTLF